MPLDGISGLVLERDEMETELVQAKSRIDSLREKVGELEKTVEVLLEDREQLTRIVGKALVLATIYRDKRNIDGREVCAAIEEMVGRSAP